MVVSHVSGSDITGVTQRIDSENEAESNISTLKR